LKFQSATEKCEEFISFHLFFGAESERKVDEKGAIAFQMFFWNDADF
jgi:hypothetical protein